MAYNAFKDYLSRKHANLTGDAATYNAEPMISGFFLSAIRLPAAIANNLETEFPEDVIEEIDGDFILSANVRSVTPPNVPEIQIIEKPGLGGTGLSLPSILTLTKTIEIQFDEYYMAPITRVVKSWVYSIRDPLTGLSRISGVTQADYKGTMDLVYFDPSGSNVLFAIRFYGIWPSNVPFSSFTADITTSELIMPSVTFNFDLAYHTKVIEDDVKTILETQLQKLISSSGSSNG